MKLERIALESFRRFRDGVELSGLQDGLNIVAGPNEAGKSTYATAIRAAFLERYKTSTVTDFAPWGVSGARPGVELAFSHDGHDYVLRKYFLSRARCELTIDGGARRLEGEEAENALAALLGFEFPNRGQSKPEHAGVPGLLWIAQGQGQELLEPAGHAATHLREALTQLTGELAANDGDRLFDRVTAERAELLDARSGKPKGAWREAEEAYAQAEQRRTELEQAKSQLDADVDRLERLRAEHVRTQREAPWADLEARAAQARERLAGIARERDSLASLRREQDQAAGTLALLREQAARDERDAQALAALDGQVAEARSAAGQAAETAAWHRAASQAQSARLEQARAQLAQAQAHAARRDLDEQIAQHQREGRRLDEAWTEAERVTRQMQALQAERVRDETDPAELARLRKLEQALATLLAQQQAVATRIHHRLDTGIGIDLDGKRLTGEGDTLLTGAAELRIPGVGLLRIEPGGKDLPALVSELAARQAERTACLARLGVASLEEGEARARRHERSGHDLEALKRELRIHAPNGPDALRSSIDEHAVRLARLVERQEKLPATQNVGESDSNSVISEASAVQTLQETEAASRQADAALATAQSNQEAMQAQARLLQSQLDTLRAEAADPARQAQREARDARLADAQTAADTLRMRVAQADEALARQQPDLLEQDLRRYERSATLAREAQQTRHTELLQLQGKLEQAGAQGLGERLAETRAEVERLSRRRAEFARRAAALDLLWRLLGERRTAATQRLLEPLARRLGHYLNLLMPGAQLRLDDALLPAGLRRGGEEDTLGALSFGTREQLGVLARLAYADLLREAGRPTLLILDDALVHADEGRRDLMKRALFDAASRHQILLFTCHPQDWKDMGVPVRQLP
ncbi:GTP-binding protein [Bordetella ansorpii]|uniref:GTP-binding protein n=1 Tax=Bordetella ansorpii TaxID=288768 RepID=A0A157RA99_9BORD|nr:AAA family ATPase [Bordetella ansorpii]SAI54888.1 GTP-binding protein [Bordetella ansorpii]